MSIRRSLGWVGVAQASFVVTQFVGSVILARLLTPREMGVYALASSVVGLVAMVQSLGLAEFIISQRELHRRTIAAAFTVNAVLALLVAVLVGAVALFGGFLLNDASVSHVLLVISVLPLIGALEFRPGALMQREARFKALALINIGRHLTATVVTVLLAFRGFSSMSLAYGQIMGSMAAVILINLIGFRHASLAVSISEWRRIGRFGLQMLAIGGVNNLTGRVADIALGRLLGLAELGLFSRAQNIFSLVWNNVHSVAGGVIMSDFAAQRREGRSLRPRYLSAVAMFTGLLWPAFTGLAVLAGPLINLVYGEKWLGAAIPLSLLCFSALPLIAITMTWEVFIACGETARQAKFETWRSLIGLALFTTGCLFSLNAAAAAKIGDSTVTYLIYRRHLERMTDTHRHDFVGLYRQGLLLTLAAVAPAVGVMAWYGWSPKAASYAVAAAIVAGLGLWLVALRALGHPLLGEISRVLRRLRPA